ncbi:MAG TPA: cobyrinate a,c-diamide synthase [Thermohalobaculum sp.]|nr:cobyrinate a,c-diamide synthase [Thermohalobaculum sp.]
MTDGLVIAAPASGSGKTVVTLALLRALAGSGPVASAKLGADYIDPRFHEVASARICPNLDAWAMRPGTIARILNDSTADLLLIEGVMGLFDGPDGAPGSTADLAAALRLPVILVLDVARQGQSVAALARGFSDFRADVEVAGVILNRVGSERHAAMLRTALDAANVRVFGAIPRSTALALPERHLGLVQAAEHPDIDAFLSAAAALIAGAVDLEAIRRVARQITPGEPAPPLPPLGQRIALAADPAFAFAYPHLLSGWRAAGAEILPFSPLADEAPDEAADAVFLPGGYPELHAGRLSANRRFLDGLGAAAERNALIYGECGGFMMLGERLIDADGHAHAMANLVPLTTSFAARQLSLGYREMRHDGALPFPPTLRGHEFHYSTLVTQGAGTPLFEVRDAAGHQLPSAGLRLGRVMGSYLHVIDGAV